MPRGLLQVVYRSLGSVLWLYPMHMHTLLARKGKAAAARDRVRCRQKPHALG